MINGRLDAMYFCSLSLTLRNPSISKVMHHETSNISLAVASIYDSTQKSMDYSDEFFDLEDDQTLVNITNITWLGETEQEAANGGPNGYGVIVAAPPNEVIVAVNEPQQEEDKRSLLAYALTVPLLLLLAALLLMKRRQVKRKLQTKDQFFWGMFDDVLIGTGDHPDAFHEGMYHYSQYGVRYLSTNCKQCIETKKNGFFTADNLDTISEHSVETEGDFSAHRKKYLVHPNTLSLGAKHSLIDVHNCNSARCHICKYKPRNVEFISKIDENFEVEDFEIEVPRCYEVPLRSAGTEVSEEVPLSPGESEV